MDLRAHRRHVRSLGSPIVFRLALALLLGLACPLAARAGAGVLVRGETLTSGALEPFAVFGNGRSVEFRRLALALGELDYLDSDLLLHDLESGRTAVVDDDVAGRRLVSLEAPGSLLGDLLLEPGSLVLFESSGAPDPQTAETFWRYSPTESTATYLAANTDLTGDESDLDGDGIANASDNCPRAANSAQTDTDVDGLGDACECGDVDDDGRIDRPDVDLYRERLADPVGRPFSPAGVAKCAVIGSASECEIRAVVVLRRVTISAPLPPGIAQVCSAATQP